MCLYVCLLYAWTSRSSPRFVCVSVRLFVIRMDLQEFTEVCLCVCTFVCYTHGPPGVHRGLFVCLYVCLLYAWTCRSSPRFVSVSVRLFVIRMDLQEFTEVCLCVCTFVCYTHGPPGVHRGLLVCLYVCLLYAWTCRSSPRFVCVSVRLFVIRMDLQEFTEVC